MADYIIRPLSDALNKQVQSGMSERLGNPVSEVTADASPGYPCRYSLVDATPGEALLLFSHSPFDRSNAYRETGPVFIRKNAKPAQLGVNELPEVTHARKIVLRAYDTEGTMRAAVNVETEAISEQIKTFLDDPGVGTVHLRAALSGCFLCMAVRAPLNGQGN